MPAQSADLAEEARAVLARRRVTQASAARAIGLSQPAISRRLSGTIPFSAAEIAALAEFVGVPVSTFYGETPTTPGGVSDAYLTRPADDAVGTASSATHSPSTSSPDAAAFNSGGSVDGDAAGASPQRAGRNPPRSGE